MAKKDLEDIVRSEASHNPNSSSDISTKKYLGWKLAGHGLGALFSVSSAYGFEKLLGYGRAATSALTEVVDWGLDNTGFNLARYTSERKNPRYKGLAGIGRYISDSVGYAFRHIPGALLGMAVAGLSTYGIATYFKLPVYLAVLVPRTAEIITEIVSSTFFTKRYRQRLAQLSPQPSYAT